jgi:hypothetical protein
LNEREDSSIIYDEYEEVIHYEIEVGFDENTNLRKNFLSKSKKSKKYKMHTAEHKRRCVERVN